MEHKIEKDFLAIGLILSTANTIKYSGGPLLKLLDLTAEGRVVEALIDSPRTYSQLRLFTRLSDRWLSEKLKMLRSRGVIELRDGKYQLTRPETILEDAVFLQYVKRSLTPLGKARIAAERIARDDQVVAIILFGSVAKGVSTEDSDLDLLIITREDGDVERELNDQIYNLMFSLDIPIESLFLTYDELLLNLQAKTTFIFGVAEGYAVLYDRGGVEKMLGLIVEEIERKWRYEEEVGAWLLKKPLSISRAQKSN